MTWSDIKRIGFNNGVKVDEAYAGNTLKATIHDAEEGLNGSIKSTLFWQRGT